MMLISRTFCLYILLMLIEILEVCWPTFCYISYIMRNGGCREKEKLVLTQAVLEYCYYGNKRVTLAQDILKTVLKKYSVKHEEFADFIADMYERIPQIVTKYEFYGIHFEHYIMRLVHLNFKRYSRTKQRTTTYENACIWSEHIASNGSMYVEWHREQSKFDNIHVHCNNSDIIELMLHVLGVRQQPLRIAQRKWLLILAVKCAYWLNATDIRAVAQLADYNADRLRLIMESIRLQLEKKSATRLSYVEKRNHTYSNMLTQYCDVSFVYEPPIKYGEHGCDRARSSMKKKQDSMQKIDRFRRRLVGYNTKITNNNLTPTNGAIGHMLSIPKGTVDSVLYKIRHRYMG